MVDSNANNSSVSPVSASGSVPLIDGWASAHTDVESIQESRCAGDIPGDTYRFLDVRTRISSVRWKHVLYPIWSLSFTWKEKSYPVLVHGQTGRVVGEAPYSWWKLIIFVLVVLGVVFGGAALIGLIQVM